MNRNEVRLTATDMDLQYRGLSKAVEGYGMKDTTYGRTENWRESTIMGSLFALVSKKA